MVEETYAAYKRTASRKTALNWKDTDFNSWVKMDGGAWSIEVEENGGTFWLYFNGGPADGQMEQLSASSMEEAKREAEQIASSKGIAASRVSSHRTAFLDSLEIPEPRHRVAGWDWDDHLNGFIAAEAAREFTCSCGSNIPAPGYTDCRCGKRWNAYTVSANGSKKMIAREVPVRQNVVMARTASSRKQAADYSNYSYDQLVDERDTLRQQYADWEIDQSEYRDTLAEIEAEAESRGLNLASREGRVVARTARRKTAVGWSKGTHPDISDLSDEQLQDFIDNVQESIDAGANVGEIMKNKRDRFEEELRSRGRKATRKQAASSPSEVISQHFSGWQVDDDDGDFWEIQSPGREHAFIHEGGDVYTVLINDGTSREVWETGLSFDEALEEFRAEGVI